MPVSGVDSLPAARLISKIAVLLLYHVPTRDFGSNFRTVFVYPIFSAELSTFLGTFTHSFSSIAQERKLFKASLLNSEKHLVLQACSPLHRPRHETPLIPRGLENKALVWSPHFWTKQLTSDCSIWFSFAYSANPSYFIESSAKAMLPPNIPDVETIKPKAAAATVAWIELLALSFFPPNNCVVGGIVLGINVGTKPELKDATERQINTDFILGKRRENGVINPADAVEDTVGLALLAH